MEATIANSIFIAIGISIGIFATYLFNKVKNIESDIMQITYEIDERVKKLEEEIKTFPTPEDLAKAILKIKVPVSNLPKEMQEMVKSGKVPTGTPSMVMPPNMFNPMMGMSMPVETEENKKESKKKRKKDYIG